MIFTNNTDRTGSRLLSIASGLLLSKLLNVPYKIQWNSYPSAHEEIKINNIFSENFIKKYLIKNVNKVDFYFHHLDFNSFKNEDLIKPKIFYEYLKKRFKNNKIDSGNPNLIMRFIKNKKLYVDYILKELEFNVEIKKIKELVQQINFLYTPLVVREGDILSDDFNYFRFNGKAFSALNAVFLIKNKLINDPFLLGEELHLQNKLSTRFKLKKINYEQNLNYAEKLFYDIFVIANANTVIANNSSLVGFSNFYGSNKLIKFKEFINTDNFIVYENTIYTELQTYGDWYSSEQKAFAFLNLYQQAKRLKVRENDLESYLLECIKYKDNAIYNLYLIDFYLEKKQLFKANKVFEKFKKNFNVNIKQFINKKFFCKKFSISTRNFLSKKLMHKNKLLKFSELKKFLLRSKLSITQKNLELLIDLSPSQLGADLLALFFNDFAKHKYFIEIGANDGLNLSNSLMLERDFFWNGVLVEPNSKAFQSLQSSRSNIKLNYAVSDKSDSVVEFKEYKDSLFSCISEKNTGRYKDDFDIKTIQTITLTEIFKRYCLPKQIEYLSIDTEGNEFEIIKDFDFDMYKVKTISIEHNHDLKKANLIRNKLLQHNYLELKEKFLKFDMFFYK
jgi:FkbM family methyltransferase